MNCRTWKCRACGSKEQVSYEDILEIGTPICCDREMQLLPLRQADKPKVRLVVRMFGGAVEAIYADSRSVNVTDVVFTEDPKHVDWESTFTVKSAPLKGQVIYCHHGVGPAGARMFRPVFDAATARILGRPDEPRRRGGD